MHEGIGASPTYSTLLCALQLISMKKIYYTVISIALLQLAAITIINETRVWKSDPYHKYSDFLK